MNFEASRLASVQPSASAGISHKAKGLKAVGYDVIDLGLGEPDFDTPLHVIEAAHQGGLSGQTKYPPNDGTAELKAAIVSKLARENSLDYSPAEVIVSNGAKQIIFGALMATLEPGQEVLLCAPYFDSYENIILAIGGKPVIVVCAADNGFCLTPELLEAAITPNTRWLFLNHPSNPAGAVYTRQQLQALGEVLLRHSHVIIMSDEIYEHILFDGREFSAFGAVCPELRERTLTVNGVSKAYAMTGWRIGWGAGPKALITAMSKMQSLISSGACSIAQAAAAAAYNGPQDQVESNRQAFQRRRDIVVDAVVDIPGLSLDAPGGAFYALIECSGVIGATKPDGTTIESDVNFVSYVLDEAKVASVPGSAYGVSPFFRLSTANSEEKLLLAMGRIAECVEKLKLPEENET